jgi:transposase InsO family protein
VSYAFIHDHVARFPVVLMCEVLEVSRSGSYDWLARPERRRAASDRTLAAEVRAVRADSRGRCGSPRVHAELRAHGRRGGRKRGARLMRGMGLSARRKRRFRRTTDRAHAHPVAPNLLGRDFTASAPDRVWLADLTSIWTAEGWLYLAVVLDRFSRRVVGWAMAEHLGHDLALAALEMAIARRRPAPGLIHHSDRGVQGGIKWSSQHPSKGSCDAQSKAAVRSVGAGASLLTRSPAGRGTR